MITRICVICGAQFDVYPSSPRKTCSPSCRCQLKSRSHTGRRHPWSDASKQRLRDKPKPDQLSLGHAAAMALPDSQRGSGHRDCKVWRLRSPDGQDYTAVGILPWARENAWRFGETDESGALRIASGFRQIALSARGKTKRSVSSYKGWTLLDLPARKGPTKGGNTP